MSFVWAEYHRLCETLLKTVPSGLEEATFRCVCSRAYYAAFCTARDVAQALDGLALARGGIDHGIVLRHFMKHS